MNILIVGVGYVGLVTGLSFAKFGHKVNFFDIHKEKINSLKEGKVTFYEPELKELLLAVKDNISFTDELNDLQDSDIIFICTGTPTTNNEIDLTYVKKACEKIGSLLKNDDKFRVVIIKSTVLPGSTNEIIKPLLQEYSNKKAGKEFGLCVNPEFLREGSAVKDILEPDRIVIGCYGEKEKEMINEFYNGMFKNLDIVNSNLTTAEMAKYVSNSFFPLLISFSNEIANICENTGEKVDVEDVLNALNLDKRINPILDGKRIKSELTHYLKAGCGFGGSCFPKDLMAFSHYSKKSGYTPHLLDSTLKINNSQISRLINKLEKAIGSLNNKKIAVLGLSFKPNTDDIRESPSIKLILELVKRNVKVIAHDPISIENTKKELREEKNIDFKDKVIDTLKDSDACFIVTSWEDYFNLKEDDFKSNMKDPVIVDCRRIYNKDEFQNVKYIGVGLKDDGK